RVRLVVQPPRFQHVFRAIETPYGRDKDDPILVDPATGKPYRMLPKQLMERIQREVERKWTYQIGRRIACSLAVIHAPRLTGHPWASTTTRPISGTVPRLP